jgi:hypothetical protein
MPGRAESNWWTGYMPSLSPIPSMSVSEALDESSSRGRPSSRWWEISQEGSAGAPSSRLERTKRESKYMGMPKELREALQWENGDGSSSQDNVDGTAPGPSSSSGYGPDEYPPEKTGLHDESVSQSFDLSVTSRSFSAPPTPDPELLDVSRLVTLPPPYPRHHPAVNNNHPDLTSIRTVVRTLSDLAEVQVTKTRFTTADTQLQEKASAAAAQRRNSLNATIQHQIATGNMTYAEAASLEASSAAAEDAKIKEAVKASFERFQTDVVIPLNDLLMDRINQASDLFSQLRSKLFVDAQERSPNLPQEEGDEQPELLEKLTLLKWIFEARESLHRELYNLLSERNDRYKDMVLTPYRLSHNYEKIENTQLFFATDALKRKLAFETEGLNRTTEFLDIIEDNVTRGVEVQLSAFWDIAPNLRSLIEKVPLDLEGFRVQVPIEEMRENPEYAQWPTRYLWSLLGHAERSTYQFIESQINLLCLLHEVKSGVMIVKRRVDRADKKVKVGVEEDEEVSDIDDGTGDDTEEEHLTLDLKEKVAFVEEQWSGALGDQLKIVKKRIADHLVERGGWDEEEN